MRHDNWHQGGASTSSVGPRVDAQVAPAVTSWGGVLFDVAPGVPPRVAAVAEAVRGALAARGAFDRERELVAGGAS